MNVSRRISSALAGAALLSLFLFVYVLAGASSAQAAGPATVSVRVEGLTETKVPLAQVTTTTEPVVKDGTPADSCPGTSAAGALQLATAGNWSGTWYGGEVKDGVFEGLGYSAEVIEGESHLFESGSTADYYWSFWFNDKLEEEHGVCGVEMATGDRVLMLVECAGSTCPPNPTPLEIEGPATAAVGEPTTVTVTQYDTKGEPSPAVGAEIAWTGASATTDSQGHATLKFGSAGAYILRVTGASAGPPAVRTEANICVHNGNDGTCGTQAPGNSPVVKSSPGSGGTTVNSEPAVIEAAKIAGVKNGHLYSHRRAPRLLKGSVVVPAGGLLQKVQISLKRRYHGRCYGFDGRTVRFVAIKCKRAASFFSVGTEASFSYLLPARLPAGSYTYDIEAVNGTGQATKLVSGVSHVVFQVK